MNKRIPCCAALLLAAIPAFSAELEYALRGGLSSSDNVERLPDGLERSSSAAVAGLIMRGERPEGRLRYVVATDMAYNEYFSHGLESELTGSAALRGSYDFVPQVFGWNASLAYDQARADILRPLAPGNSDDTLTLSTGPTLRARLSGALEAELDGHITRTVYEERPFDNQTVGGRALIARRPGSRSMLALGGSYSEVFYQSGGGADALNFNRKEIFTRLELQGVRTEVDLEVGYADISGQLVDDGGAMLRAHLSRRLTPSVTGFLSAVREYPTSEETGLSADPALSGGADPGSDELTSGPRLATSVGGGLRFVRPRTELEFAYTYREEEGLAGGGKRKYGELRGQLARDFTPQIRGAIRAAINDEDFSAVAGNAQERILGGALEFSLGRALGLDLQIEHRKRDGITAADEYSELSGGIFLRYSGQL